MALEVAWMLTALIILATVCIGVFKAILGDGFLFSRGPRDFLLDRLARYGDPFTVSLMGSTYTVLNSPETMKFVLSTGHESFPLAYPEQFGRILRPERFAGDRHLHFRKIILSAASGDGLQKQVPFINSLAEITVKSWENQAVVNSAEELEKFVFNVAMRILWRDVEPGSEEMNQLRNEMSRVGEGLAALPINFPGFTYHKALKAKQVLVSRFQSEISRRRKAGIEQDDVLNALMNIREVEIPDCDICCMMVGIIFAASETTASLIPFVLKYLDNFPEVRQRVQVGTMQDDSNLEEGCAKKLVESTYLSLVPTACLLELFYIFGIVECFALIFGIDEQDCLQQKMIEEKSLTWFKLKSNMPYTLQVMYEILRIEYLTIMPRQANKDVDYNGSYVWASATSLHFDPKHHPNPREFVPSRFIEKPNPNAFLSFGQGPHLCPGRELALTESMLIIHHLITNYSWERCGSEEVIEYPLPKLATYPIRLVKRYMT